MSLWRSSVSTGAAGVAPAATPLEPRTDHAEGHGGDAAQQPMGLVHVCKCTCFTTNTTLIPLYVPDKQGNLCSTCTKQFCVQRAESCRGAKIAESNVDTSTGFEGEVWAQCFGASQTHAPARLTGAVRDPTRDQTIVTFYLLFVLGLLLWALLRSRTASALLTRTIGAAQRAVQRART